MGTSARAGAALALLVVGVLLAVLLVHVGHGGTPGRQTATCSADDGDADRIQDMIDDSQDGDEIVFDGPCLIDQTIVLRGNRAYRGESPTTELRAAPGSNLAAVLASDSWDDGRGTTGDPISLRDVTVDADREQNPRGGDGIIIRSWHSQIEDVRITDARGSCLRVTGRSRDGTDIGDGNTQVQGTLRSIFAFHCGVHGIYAEDKENAVTDWNLTDSWIGDTGSDGIRLENSAGWAVHGNHLYDVGGNGIEAVRLFATSLTDNYVEDFGDGFGIVGYAQGSAGSVIQGNRVFQVQDVPDGTLLGVVGAEDGTSVVAVTGNVLRGNGSGTGLSYRTEGAALSVTSAGNSVTDVTTPQTGEQPDGGY